MKPIGIHKGTRLICMLIIFRVPDGIQRLRRHERFMVYTKTDATCDCVCDGVSLRGSLGFRMDRVGMISSRMVTLSIVILALFWTSHCYGHGYGQCDEGDVIRHSPLPHWYSTPNDGNLRHHHVFNSGTPNEYVASYVADCSPYVDVADCEKKLEKKIKETDNFTDCSHPRPRPNPTPPPPPRPQTHTTSQSSPSTRSSSSSSSTPSSSSTSSTSSSSSTRSRTLTSSTSSSSSVSPPTTVEELIEEMDSVVESDPEPDIEVVPDPDPEPEPEIILDVWERQFYRGWNLVVFPVLPVGVETIKDLYNQWTALEHWNAKILVYIDNEWLLYDGNDSPTGGIRLSPHLAMAIHLDASWLVGVRGVAQVGRIIDLDAGLNFIGIPQVPAAYKRPSDFLRDGVYTVFTESKGVFYLIGRVGDRGDDLLVDGQAVLITSQGNVSLDLSASIPSAPSAHPISLKPWGSIKSKIY